VVTLHTTKYDIHIFYVLSTEHTSVSCTDLRMNIYYYYYYYYYLLCTPLSNWFSQPIHCEVKTESLYVSQVNSPAYHHEEPGLISGQFTWAPGCTKWHSDMFLFQYFGFSMPVSLYQRCTVICIYMLLLPDGRSLENCQKGMLFRKSGNAG